MLRVRLLSITVSGRASPVHQPVTYPMERFRLVVVVVVALVLLVVLLLAVPLLVVLLLVLLSHCRCRLTGF